ncbi:MAG: accessory factor UbiK family protein [Maricaulis sp.]|uniref:accessory factor UbiK family protein n=1 Tax=Maricaulis sp. TaxID=1486257 RepID=UPI001B102A00|nr:accessory factor UbiK family protein [Maricaulis sp.]MBO6847450.1 accessory factor UbiK family protein [Maricaulis sp.]MBO6877020.1 accessory factor UbiK family protein [Maricaulis sp.]MEC9251317.1 accessory factor UbiK family protein [Pseudomonadota bacterium]
MQTRNPLLNDFADLMTDAFGAAQAVGEEAQAVFRAQADRLVADMDLVSREEYDAVKASLAEAHDQIAALEARLEKLEKAKKPATPRKPRASKAKTAATKSTD